MNDFLKLAENLGWSYNVDDTPNERGEVCVELEKYSPKDQDFIATILFENGNKSDFMDKLYLSGSRRTTSVTSLTSWKSTGEALIQARRLLTGLGQMDTE